MKIQTFAAMSVAVAALAFSPSVYAIATECTDAQLTTAETNEGDEFQKTCPSLFKDGEEVIDLSNLDAFDAAVLAQITPCKEPACTAFLAKLYEKAPDCSSSGLNIKSTYNGLQQVCTKIATGNAKLEDVVGILKGLVSNVTFEEASSGSDSEEETPVAGNSTTTMPVSTTAATPEPTTVKPKDAAQTTTPAPSTTKSNAVAVTGIAGAVASTLLATALLL